MYKTDNTELRRVKTMKRNSITTLFFFALVFLTAIRVQAQTQSQQETLKQYIAELQKSPNDNALREKIILFVLTMKPTPPISEEAREHFIMAETFLKKAKENKDYELAIEEYKAALLLAPWWSLAYNNLGFIYKSSGNYDEAIGAFKFYILTNPSDARAAQDTIYALAALKKFKAKETKEKAIAEEIKKKSENDYLAGHWKFVGGNERDACTYSEFHLEGNVLTQEIIYDREYKYLNLEHNYIGDRMEPLKWQKVGDKIFQRNQAPLFPNSITTIEFVGNTIIETYSGSENKNYYRRE